MLSIDEMTSFCIESCARLGRSVPDLKITLDCNPRIASYSPNVNTIVVDQNVVRYLSEADVKTILLHEVCHVLEILQAREDGNVVKPDYKEEFRKTKGHNQAFKDLAERASKELNDGVGVFKVPEFFCDIEPDNRVRLLCDAMKFNIKNVAGCIGYFDISMNEDEKVLVKPDILDGSKLNDFALGDIADSIACAQGAKSDWEFDNAIEIADKVWSDWASEKGE